MSFVIPFKMLKIAIIAYIHIVYYMPFVLITDSFVLSGFLDYLTAFITNGLFDNHLLPPDYAVIKPNDNATLKLAPVPVT